MVDKEGRGLFDEGEEKGKGEGNYLVAVGGQAKGITVEDALRGSGSGGGSEGGGADVAPSSSQFVDGCGMPKGKILTEGGFTDNDGKKNASVNGEIGGEKPTGMSGGGEVSEEAMPTLMLRELMR